MILRQSAINDWLQTLLRKRNVDAPTGNPLYSYQLNETEFFTLNSLLKQSSYSLQHSKDTGWCAAFCLYGAEWYRRQYISGWSWLEIFAGLGYEIDPNKRPDVVEKGLAFWKRSVSQYENGQKSYLGTVFSEGGVPFALLASEGSRFQQMFKRLLIDYDHAKALGVSTIPYIQQQLKNMANAFQQETTVSLLDRMVSELYKVIDGFSLETQDHPVAYLDREYPNWRLNFPIPLDNTTGEELLSGLLKSAASHRKATKEQGKRIQVMQWLANTDALQLSTRIELAKTFSIEYGRGHFSSPMVEVLICEGKQPVVRLGLVRVELNEKASKVHLTRTRAEFSRGQLEAPLSIVLMQGGNECYREVLPNTALMLSEMPLVFEKREDRHVFVGQGSVSKKAPSLWVLMSNAFQVLPSEEMAEIRERANKDDYCFLEFVGELAVHQQAEEDSDEFVVSTKADQFSKELLEIKGEEFEIESNLGYPVYKGFPWVSCLYPESKIYIGNQKIEQLQHLSGFFGRQVLKVKAAGKTLYRKKIAILPKSFSLQIRAGKTANQGFVHVSCEQRITSAIQSDVSVKSHKTDNGKVFELVCDGTSPSNVDVEVRANLLAEPIVFRVPFPAKGALLFDAHNKVLPRKLVIDQLLGARAMLFAEPDSNNTCYNIELNALSSSRHSVQENYSYRVSDAYQEVSLYEFRHKIKALLAASDALDAVVRMVVSSPSCDSKQYEIGRYSVSPQKEGQLLAFNERDVKDFADLKVELINLSDPNEKPRPVLQRSSGGAPIGKFELPSHLDSPYLAVPSEDSTISFRAIFIPATHSVLNTNQAKSLSKAVAEFHPKANPRAFDFVLNDMARDLTHSSWSYLDALFGQFTHLPMVTFEVWKALAKHPSCLAAYVFATKHDVQEVMQSMQIELNVLWELLPASAWQRAEGCYREYLTVKGCPEEFLGKRVSNKKNSIARFLGLSDLFDVSAKKGPMYFTLIEMWRADLLRHKSDDGVVWPEHYAMALEQWISHREPNLLCFDIPSRFQVAVVLFPIVAAAIVAGRTTWKDVLGTVELDNVLVRQLMDFDRAWFESVFQCCLCVYSEE
ncbi:STY4851/ECs_5259 family protein [Marinomonas aquiplantarum]|uniref:Uncharacterized protein n=1 Tax=Marinomonas aquiplantarum TaxID=491951 RepID=A0A366CTF9_9GAMM|nr:STY4851/ECs_5259 family protein [Marinomonas aquiplantarum]RBO79593.1 hypothetical protein DFP76_11350 [Marinomonas aquiplantarum]